MNITRSKYKDGTYADAVAEGYDLFQLKYDGNWCVCESSDGLQDYYSDTYRRVGVQETPWSDCPSGLFIGELMRGTQWSTDPSRRGRFFVFDYLLGETDSTPYMRRYAYLRSDRKSVV